MARSKKMRVGKMQCPACFSDISSEAVACKKCGHDVPETQLRAQEVFEAKIQARVKKFGPYLNAGLAIILLGVGTCTYQAINSPARDQAGTATSGGAAPSEAPPLLPASDRFAEFSNSHPLRTAQDALNAGDPTKAAEIFVRRRGSDDAMTKRFKAALQKAWNEQIGHDPAATLMDRIDTYWLPELKKMTPPGDPGEVAKIRLALENYARSLEDAKLAALSAQQRSRRRDFLAALAAKQRTLFPAMRRLTSQALRSGLFRADIDIEIVGRAASTVRLSSFRFTSNANIADAFAGLSEPLRRLRFKRAEFGTGSGVRYHYALDVPPDTAIGYWEPNAEFVDVEKRTADNAQPAGSAGTDKDRPANRDPSCIPEVAAGAGLEC
jgi:hypothetical protein